MSRPTCRPLTPDLWPALEALFGPEQGANGGCWCTWWRLTRKDWTARGRAGRKALFRRIVVAGPPPGILAFDGDRPVGWCAIEPRGNLPGLDRSPVCAAVDGSPAWAITCFYIAPDRRRSGLMAVLIDAAVAHARANGARLVEAYPKDTDARAGSGELFVGVASAFQACGFAEVARRSPSRSVVRRAV